MRTFTVQVKDSDADLVKTILKKLKAKVIEGPQESPLTLEIVAALGEVKKIQDWQLKPLTLKDI